MLFHVSTLLPLLLVFSPTTLAGGCEPIIGAGTAVWVCGSVQNNTPWTLLYTTNPNTSDPKVTGYCQFWNWPSFLWVTSKRVKCTQQPLAPGAFIGKDEQGGTDVDGFTFADRDWYLHGKKFTKGIWHKFATTTNVVCDNVNGEPMCVLT